MFDYLLDAMNEISDEHITEAANYEAKAKKQKSLTLRRLYLWQHASFLLWRLYLPF